MQQAMVIAMNDNHVMNGNEPEPSSDELASIMALDLLVHDHGLYGVMELLRYMTVLQSRHHEKLDKLASQRYSEAANLLETMRDKFMELQV